MSKKLKSIYHLLFVVCLFFIAFIYIVDTGNGKNFFNFFKIKTKLSTNLEKRYLTGSGQEKKPFCCKTGEIESFSPMN